MSQKSPLRQRITPAVPYLLKVENPDESFTLGFSLSYDLNSLSLVELKTGVNMLTQLGAVLDNPSVTVTTALFWAAVQQNHPEYEGDLGLRAIRNLLSLAELKPALEACVEAFLTQLPKEKADKLRTQIEAARAALAKGEPIPEAPTQGPATETAAS